MCHGSGSGFSLNDAETDTMGTPMVNATNHEGATMQTIDEARELCRFVGNETEKPMLVV